MLFSRSPLWCTLSSISLFCSVISLRSYSALSRVFSSRWSISSLMVLKSDFKCFLFLRALDFSDSSTFTLTGLSTDWWISVSNDFSSCLIYFSLDNRSNCWAGGYYAFKPMNFLEKASAIEAYFFYCWVSSRRDLKNLSTALLNANPLDLWCIAL